MARYLALTCEALARPVYAAAAVSPHTVNVRLFKQGLHNRPKGLRVTLQDEIDAIPQASGTPSCSPMACAARRRSG